MDIEKGLPAANFILPSDSEPTSTTSSEIDLKKPSTSRLQRGWEKFNYYNGKMEAAMGIEAVSRVQTERVVVF